MLKELLEKERKILNYFFDSVELDQANQLLDLLINCKGLVCLTGVGKSGIIANKVAMTMISTGTRAYYLSSTDARHGDLGILSDQDIVLMFSKSGESDELLSLVPSVRNKGVTLVSITSIKNSRLERACDLSIFLPVEKELCPFDLAPTTSTAIQLIFGDVLTIALMKKRNFSLDQYALNHPAGRIGKRITMRVCDLMVKDPSLPLCLPTKKLGEVLVDLSNKKCGCMLVVGEDRELFGIFTDGDLRRSLQSYGPELLDKEMQLLMKKSPKVIRPDLLALEAMDIMENDQKNPITVLPVVEENRVVGLIKMHDIVQSGI